MSPTTPTPALDVVVTNYHTPTDLHRCLASLQRYAPEIDHTITIVNVEPNPEDDRVAAEFVTTNANWSALHLPENIGYNRACNLGGAKGSGSVIAYLNADVIITDGALDALVAAITDEPGWGTIGPRQVDANNRHVAAGIFGSPPHHRSWMALDRGQFGDIREDASFVCGSILLMRRDVADELTRCPLYRRFAPTESGPWGTFHHFEGDAWLGMHARAHGFANVYYGPVKCFHYLHGSRRRGSEEADRQDEADVLLLRQMAKAHGMLVPA